MQQQLVCRFCRKEAMLFNSTSGWIDYSCKRCGNYRLTREAAEDLDDIVKSETDGSRLSIVLRNAYESRGRILPKIPLTRSNLINIIEEYRERDPLEKMDIALLKLEEKSRYIGEKMRVDLQNDYPYYHCINDEDLKGVLLLIYKDAYTTAINTYNPNEDVMIDTKGYNRLRELHNLQPDSMQAFVAMWFSDEMKDAYDKAIVPAIELEEDGVTRTGFKTIKINDVQHLNDINDEIIAQIRRSRFLVCDLTGYRGGVYFEAGFAYGLGLKVFYTCRKDWCKPDKLYNSTRKQKKSINVLYDNDGRQVEVKKEGVHFDIDHMNRIEWEDDNDGKLKEFETKLRNRIKANIF